MPNAHPRPWRRDSVFGAGPRRALDREQRARFRFLLNAHRRGRRLTPLAELIGNALVKRLGVDGQLDPAHETVAADVGCASRTVRRALDAMRALGLVLWQRRIIRDGWAARQTSNSYILVPAGSGTLPTIPPIPCGGQPGRQTLKKEIHLVQQPTTHDLRAAQSALAERRRVVEQGLLTKKRDW